jgi:hypothetical protein
MRIKDLISIFSIGLLISCSPKTAQRVGSTTPSVNINIDWTAYDNNSTVKREEIKVEQLQGEWAAYKGIYKFGEHLNAMMLEKPIIIDIKQQTYRRSKDSAFEQFQLIENLVIHKTTSKSDTGIINKLTATELTISWKNGSNYTRYMYEKTH